MHYREEPERTKTLAQMLVARYGTSAATTALAIAATLIDSGLLDYAQLWQNVATLLGGGS